MVDDARLHEASESGDCDAIRVLVAERPDLAKHYRQLEGRYLAPLHLARDADTVRCLLACGASPDMGHYDWKPLHQAASDGRVGAVEALLEAGARVDTIRNVSNETPLHCALLRGHDEVVAILLARGANPQARAANGATTLHHARTATATRRMLELGVASDTTDAFGYTALDLAELAGAEAASVLAAAGAPRSGSRGLHWAAGRVGPSFVSVESLGNPDVVPAFVIGYETCHEHMTGTLGALPGSLPLPPWIMQVDLTVGGYCMSYPVVTGIVLRLEGNLHLLGSQAPQVVAGFKAMSEGNVLNDNPRRHSKRLPELHLTSGDKYNASQLRLLAEELAMVMPSAPTPREGVEAWVTFESHDPLAHFAGWQMLSALPRIEQPARSARVHRAFELAQDLELSEDYVFDADALATVQHVVGRLLVKPLPPPSVFLVWENSD